VKSLRWWILIGLAVEMHHGKWRGTGVLSCEAELIAVDDIVREIECMLNLMKEFGPEAEVESDLGLNEQRK
jgi:hypothetical protein